MRAFVDVRSAHSRAPPATTPARACDHASERTRTHTTVNDVRRRPANHDVDAIRARDG